MKKTVFSKSRQIVRIAPGWLLHRLSNRQFLLVGGMMVGLWAGLTAVVLKVSVHFLQKILIHFGQQHSWIYFVSPLVGIFSTYLFIKFVLQGDLPKGTSHVLLAITKRSSFLSRKETFSHVATSALTVGLGGSAGLESPIVQTGAAIGSTFASFFPIGYRDRTLLLACGAAAGIATAFNAPIAGVLFALEVLLVDVSISGFIPLLFAGATGALCSKIILAEGVLLSFRQVSDFNYYNVPYYVLLGIACGVVSVYYLKIFLQSEAIFMKFLKTPLARLVVGCVLLGFMIFFFPALFGEGYSSIRTLAMSKPEEIFIGSPLHGFLSQGGWFLGLAVLVVGLVKVFAVSFTLNAGGNGGNLAPSLLVGACLGFSFAFLINITGYANLPTSNFCLVGMAGVLTGIFHAPLTAVFLIAELTGGYDLIIPLMIVSGLSTAVSKYLHGYSLDEAKLKQGKHAITSSKDVYVLSELSLRGFIEMDFVKVRIHSKLRDLVEAVVHSKRNIFPVTDENDNLEGIISLEDIREIMFDTSQYDSISVDQLLQKPKVVINLNDDMGLIMEKFDKSGEWNIPVLKDGKYLGFVSKSTVLTNYRERLKNEGK